MFLSQNPSPKNISNALSHLPRKSMKYRVFLCRWLNSNKDTFDLELRKILVQQKPTKTTNNLSLT